MVKEYRLSKDYLYDVEAGTNEKKIAPKGMFLKPIHIQYVPKHIRDYYGSKFTLTKEMFCYCSLGIIPIWLDFIEQIE